MHEFNSSDKNNVFAAQEQVPQQYFASVYSAMMMFRITGLREGPPVFRVPEW